MNVIVFIFVKYCRKYGEQLNQNSEKQRKTAGKTAGSPLFFSDYKRTNARIPAENLRLPRQNFSEKQQKQRTLLFLMEIQPRNRNDSWSRAANPARSWHGDCSVARLLAMTHLRGH
jgi:hypothetical protein